MRDMAERIEELREYSRKFYKVELPLELEQYISREALNEDNIHYAFAEFLRHLFFHHLFVRGVIKKDEIDIVLYDKVDPEWREIVKQLSKKVAERKAKQMEIKAEIETLTKEKAREKREVMFVSGADEDWRLSIMRTYRDDEPGILVNARGENLLDYITKLAWYFVGMRLLWKWNGIFGAMYGDRIRAKLEKLEDSKLWEVLNKIEVERSFAYGTYKQAFEVKKGIGYLELESIAVKKSDSKTGAYPNYYNSDTKLFIPGIGDACSACPRLISCMKDSGAQLCPQYNKARSVAMTRETWKRFVKILLKESEL